MRSWLVLAPGVLGLAWGCSAEQDRPPPRDAGSIDAAAPRDAGSDAARACATDGDCNDGIPCTLDQCQVGNVCGHTPIHEMCAMGQVCSATRGCSSGCTLASDCDDGRFCNGEERCIGEMCVPAARPADCDDGNACTVDACDDTAGRCTWSPAPGCDAGIVAPRDGGAPPRPFDPTMDYTGTFTIVPAQSVGCGVVSYDIRSAAFSIVGGVLRVVAGTFTLTQTPAPTGDTFDVRLDDGCGDYRMSGTFDDSLGFTGMWTAAFLGSCATCPGQSAVIVGFK